MRVAIAQMSPVWLNKEKTIKKICDYIAMAGNDNADLIVFGEAVLPGYPFWLSSTHGSQFESKIQKEIHAHYISQSVDEDDLTPILETAKGNGIAVYLGAIEKAKNRGGHSLYCSLIYIDKSGTIQSVHRKLQPTYEERLAWGQGDGHGLRVHALEEFTVGGLNCWENWMPLVRSSLYAQGENLHLAVWPGSSSLTADITRFIAKESRSFVVSVGAPMRRELVTEEIPHAELIANSLPEIIADGGSCIALPNGEWLIEPILDTEGVFTAELDLNLVLQERQNFDPSGHYSRPDVTKLILDRTRQSVLEIN